MAFSCLPHKTREREQKVKRNELALMGGRHGLRGKGFRGQWGRACRPQNEKFSRKTFQAEPETETEKGNLEKQTNDFWKILFVVLKFVLRVILFGPTPYYVYSRYVCAVWCG